MENHIKNFNDSPIEVSNNTVSVYFSRVYNWMAIALLLTGAVAYYVAGSESLMQIIVGNKILFFGLIIGELFLVGYISRMVHKISASTATMLFILYAVLNGLTLSILFMMYTSASISSTFLVTAGTFGAMSAYGFFTKKDLTKIGNLAMMALIGIIII